MEIKSKDYGTPHYKSNMIYNWKRLGILHDDFDALFEEYIATTACQHCHTPFKSTLDRCVDHDHETGQVRLIVCRKCNVNDTYINWPDGWSRKQYDVQHREQNREKIAERLSEKVKCECGTDVTRGGISTHRKTKKHKEAIIKIEMDSQNKIDLKATR